MKVLSLAVFTAHAHETVLKTTAAEDAGHLDLDANLKPLKFVDWRKQYANQDDILRSFWLCIWAEPCRLNLACPTPSKSMQD